MESPITGIKYRVYRWKDYGDGRVIALKKELEKGRDDWDKPEYNDYRNEDEK